MYSEDSETILGRMMDDVTKDIDKWEGSLTFDALSPAANEFEEAYIKLDEVAAKFDLANLEGEELATRIYQRCGITKNPATYAVGTLDVTGSGTVNEGDIFQTEGLVQFSATETIIIEGFGTVEIKALVPGASGIVPANQIKVVPVTIPGITSVNNSQPTRDGFDEESDAAILERYYEAIRTPSTQGNIAQFVKLAKDCSGVGDVKVYPTWNGNNTVKLVVIDANQQPPSSELISNVQNYMDPLGDKWGQGYGAAPFGAFTTIEGAEGKAIDVSFTAVKDANYDDTQRQSNFENALVRFLKSIAFKETAVSYMKIGDLILNTPGFLDCSDLTINGGKANIPLSYTAELTETPVKGVVTIV